MGGGGGVHGEDGQNPPNIKNQGAILSCDDAERRKVMLKRAIVRPKMEGVGVTGEI